MSVRSWARETRDDAVEMVKHPKKHLDLIQAWTWIVLAVPTAIVWKDSVLWVALMSIYANAKTSHGAHKSEKAKREASDE